MVCVCNFHIRPNLCEFTTDSWMSSNIPKMCILIASIVPLNRCECARMCVCEYILSKVVTCYMVSEMPAQGPPWPRPWSGKNILGIEWMDVWMNKWMNEWKHVVVRSFLRFKNINESFILIIPVGLGTRQVHQWLGDIDEWMSHLLRTRIQRSQIIIKMALSWNVLHKSLFRLNQQWELFSSTGCGKSFSHSSEQVVSMTLTC